MRRYIQLGFILLSLSLMLGVVVNLLSLRSALDLKQRGNLTQGIVTESQAYGGLKSCAGSAFAVHFTDAQGRQRVWDAAQCNLSVGPYTPGQQIALVYLPDDPTTVDTPTDLSYQLVSHLSMTLIFTLGLGPLLLVGLWRWRLIRKADVLALLHREHGKEQAREVG